MKIISKPQPIGKDKNGKTIYVTIGKKPTKAKGKK